MCVRVCAQTAGRCWEWLCPPGSCAEKVQLGLSPANTPRHEAVGTARPRPRQPPSAGGVVLLRRCPPPAAPLQTRANPADLASCRLGWTVCKALGTVSW